ncbi:MAG TPA: hypothetical protein DDZ66_14985 [Firmicutes bacterium]|jgi:hypothetical protein|nr:hypothetical protein [Bacillota bacterium]
MQRNWFLIAVLGVLFLFGTVSEVHGQSFKQWAITASASSEYGSGDWSAQQSLGEPNFYPNYGDSTYAWAPASMNDGLQWIELGFLEAVYVDYVEIYEIFNPGAVVKIELIDETGRPHLMWEGTGGRAATTARVFCIKNALVTVPCNKVRVTLDTDAVGGWNEIDAVSLTGSYDSPWSTVQGSADAVLQWASGAKASSQYREDRWTPEHMTGRPDVYPRYGDYETAWVASTSDGGQEWVELFYDEVVYVKRIDVYETCNPGAIVKAELIDETGRTHVFWEGRAVVAPEESRILMIENAKVDVPARHIRLVLQTDQVPGWNEIDAVSLIGTRSMARSPMTTDPFAQLASIVLRLGRAVERAKEQRLADTGFLQELEQILEDLSSLRY